MSDQEKIKLRELLLNAIEAYKQLELAKEMVEQSRAKFGYAKLYSDEPRFIEVDGKIWSVTVPFPTDDDHVKNISFAVLGDYV